MSTKMPFGWNCPACSGYRICCLGDTWECEAAFDRENQSMKPEFITVNEVARIYHFENIDVQIEDVVSINVSERGTHRLNTADGRKHIIPTGWVWIEIIADDWTF